MSSSQRSLGSCGDGKEHRSSAVDQRSAYNGARVEMSSSDSPIVGVVSPTYTIVSECGEGKCAAKRQTEKAKCPSQPEQSDKKTTTVTSSGSGFTDASVETLPVTEAYLRSHASQIERREKEMPGTLPHGLISPAPPTVDADSLNEDTPELVRDQSPRPSPSVDSNSSPAQRRNQSDEEEGFCEATIVEAYAVEEPQIVPAQRVEMVAESDTLVLGQSDTSNNALPKLMPPQSNKTKCAFLIRGILVITSFAIVAAIALSTLAVKGKFNRDGGNAANELDSSMTVKWFQVGSDLLGPLDDDEWGEEVSLGFVGEDKILRFSVSAEESNITGEASGSVYAYDLDKTKGSFNLVGQPIHGSSEGEKIRGKISADGKRLVVGAQFYNKSIGRIAVYELANGEWELMGNPIEGVSKEKFGASFDISSDGNVIVASAPLNDKKTGCVRVYQFINGEWTKLGEDVKGPVAGEQFGFSLAISGNGATVAAGPRGQNEKENFGQSGFNSGYIRIYRYVAGSWSLLGNTLAGELTGDNFGRSVSLSYDGKIVAGGTWIYNDPTSNSHRVRAFAFNEDGNTWISMGGGGLSPFGRSNWMHRVTLSADGTRLAVSSGELGDENNGSVVVFRFADGKWEQLGGRIVGVQQKFAPYISLSPDGDHLLTGYPLSRGAPYPVKGLVQLFQMSPV